MIGALDLSKAVTPPQHPPPAPKQKEKNGGSGKRNWFSGQGNVMIVFIFL